MEVIKERINILGSIRALAIDEVVTFPRPECRPSVVRCAAATLKIDFGKRFSVKVGKGVITVTRIE
jgi:hypothetical protein